MVQEDWLKNITAELCLGLGFAGLNAPFRPDRLLYFYDCPGVLDVGARGHERRWCTSVDEPHFHGSGLLLHGETREMKPATARHRCQADPSCPASSLSSHSVNSTWGR